MGLEEYGVTGRGAEEMTVGWVGMGLCGCGVREGIESLTLGVGGCGVLYCGVVVIWDDCCGAGWLWGEWAWGQVAAMESGGDIGSLGMGG